MAVACVFEIQRETSPCEPGSRALEVYALATEELPAWEAYVNGQQAASAYHQSGWKAVIEQSFGHETRYLRATETGRIVGILPLVVMKSLLFGRFVVSLPYFNYAGILADDQDAEQALLDAARRLAIDEAATHLELRHRAAHGLGLMPKRHKVTMLLGLESDVETQWRALDPKVRNQIRKAEKSGAEVQFGGQELVDSFYRIFARNMRDLGTPVYGKEFFQAILRNFPASTKIFLCHIGKRCVAAGLIVTYKDTVEMPWAASLREHRHLCGNTLVYWEAIKFSIMQGFGTFDFGRSTPGGGTFKFKEQWGARPISLTWEYWTASPGQLPEMNPTNPKYQWPIQIWKRLPMAVANRVGPLIARAIP
jgi:FemAB-related protein (PEP-CTERM system-associated)